MPAKKQKKDSPGSLSQDVINTLEIAFNLGASDMEACFYAKIRYQQLRDYLKEALEFADRREILKQRPVLEARQTVIKALKEDPKLALEFLDRAAGIYGKTKDY